MKNPCHDYMYIYEFPLVLSGSDFIVIRRYTLIFKFILIYTFNNWRVTFLAQCCTCWYDYDVVNVITFFFCILKRNCCLLVSTEIKFWESSWFIIWIKPSETTHTLEFDHRQQIYCRLFQVSSKSSLFQMKFLFYFFPLGPILLTLSC